MVSGARERCATSTPRVKRPLLGHRDVATTMVFTHVLNRGLSGVRSPTRNLLPLAGLSRPCIIRLYRTTYSLVDDVSCGSTALPRNSLRAGRDRPAGRVGILIVRPI